MRLVKKEGKMDRVKGKVAIITGGASGIGKATASLLAKEGAKVVVADVNEVNGKKVAEEIGREGGKAIFVKHDVTSENDWSEVIEKTLAEFGKLDILVNNAGVIFAKKIEDTPLEQWRWLMSVNLDGVFLGTKYAISAMKKSGGGSIINLSSLAGLVGTIDDTSAYCASKGAVRLFTKAAALECSKAGHDYSIRVNSVHPGVVETPLSEPLLKDKALRESIEGRHPIGYLGRPIDIAYAILYLASDESKFATGSELVVDGGWTAQ
jgi:NAD(P)-dependent dehydrogenase (short-subunit alcohol dehydrogenase family)